MGTWGADVFQNDQSMDFLSDVEESGVKAVSRYLNEYLVAVDKNELGWDDAPLGVALGFVVAAAHDGAPGSDEDVDRGWSRRVYSRGGPRASRSWPRLTSGRYAGLSRRSQRAIATTISREAGASDGHIAAVNAVAYAVFAAVNEIEVTA